MGGYVFASVTGDKVIKCSKAEVEGQGKVGGEGMRSTERP